MPPNIKAVIFDLDGVLIDTEPLWVKSYNIWFKNHNVNKDLILYKKMIGRGLKENMVLAKKHLGVKGDIEDLLKEIRGILYNLVSQKENIVMPGVMDLLPKLEKYKLAVATGGHKKVGAEKLLADLELGDFFEAVVSSDDVKMGKPEPDVYLQVAKLIGENPKNCLVVEDSINGVESGKAAGMTVVGVNPGLPDREELKNAGADYVFKTLEEFKI